MAKEVRLLGLWASPFVMRPRIALNIKSVEYEFIEETMNPKSELLLKSNPVYKKIPVLIHSDKPVCESLIIVQYIDEAFSSGPSILPSDPYDCSLERFWAAYVDDKWAPSLNGIRLAETDEARAAAIEEIKAGFSVLEGAFEKCSKGKPFFGGEKIGLIDITLGSFLGWVHAIEKMIDVVLLDSEKTPKVFVWAESFCAHGAIKGCMPKTEKLIEFAKILMAKQKSAPASS